MSHRIENGKLADFPAVVPHLVCKDANAAIAFYTAAFGAEELETKLLGPGGVVLHAEVRINDSLFWIADETEWGPMKLQSPLTIGGSATTINLFVKDCDKAYAQAIKAGAAPIAPPSDMFWGSRYAQVRDPSGHKWSLSTMQRSVSVQEMRAALAAMAQQGAK